MSETKKRVDAFNKHCRNVDCNGCRYSIFRHKPTLCFGKYCWEIETGAIKLNQSFKKEAKNV